MSSQLGRRAGTVGALVAAAGMTMVAGCWPALAADAPELRPGRVGSAPGQERRAAELVEHPTSAPVVVEERVLEEPVLEEPALGEPTAGTVATVPGPVEEPVAQEGAPATGPGNSAAAPGPAKTEPVPAPGDSRKRVVGPPTGVSEPGPVQGPMVQQQEAPVAQPAGRQRPADAAAAPPQARTVTGPPTQAAAPPAPAAPVVLGPVVPPPAPQRAVLTGPSQPVAGPAATTARRLSLSAADAWPLRPLGSGGVTPRAAEALAQPAAAAPPRTQRDPRSQAVDLGRALPALASGTVEAVTSRPQIPAGIVAVVVVFLLLQSRIDRRDPKLALARLEEDTPLDFAPAEAVLGARRLAAAT